MELTDSLKSLLIETAASLKGHHRRLFIARTVKQLGPGGQRRAERELGWNRVTIQAPMSLKATSSVSMPLPLAVANGRKTICQPSSMPVERLSMANARMSRQLIAQKGYTDDQLPPSQTITTKLNELGYFPKKKVAKTKPQKNSTTRCHL